MSSAAIIPPLAPDDRLPHNAAVWRDYDAGATTFGDIAPPHTAGKPVSIDYGDGMIVQSWGDEARWRGAVRWRYGWAPQ